MYLKKKILSKYPWKTAENPASTVCMNNNHPENQPAVKIWHFTQPFPRKYKWRTSLAQKATVWIARRNRRSNGEKRGSMVSLATWSKIEIEPTRKQPGTDFEILVLGAAICTHHLRQPSPHPMRSVQKPGSISLKHAQNALVDDRECWTVLQFQIARSRGYSSSKSCTSTAHQRW